MNRPTVDKVIRDYHGDGDFTWTDAEVGVLVNAIEEFEGSVFAFTQWARHPTSPGATGQALMAAQRIREHFGD